MSNSSTRPQVATVIFNKITNQFFVTFNNADAKKKGLSRPKGNYKWVKKRIAEIEAGTKSLERTPGLLHSFDMGLLWAFENSDINDWQERPLKRQFQLTEVSNVEKRLAHRMERLGFNNIRSLKTKGPDKSAWDNYNWGTWNPNKTLKQFKTMMDKIGKAMNKEFSDVIINKAWLVCVKVRPTINNKYDLWEFFKKEGLFGDNS